MEEQINIPQICKFAANTLARKKKQDKNKNKYMLQRNNDRPGGSKNVHLINTC